MSSRASDMSVDTVVANISTLACSHAWWLECVSFRGSTWDTLKDTISNQEINI